MGQSGPETCNPCQKGTTMAKPSVFRIADIQDRIDGLPENGTYIKPFVTTAISESMAGGINCLNKISVPLGPHL